MISILITRCLNTSEIVLSKLFVVGYISFAMSNGTRHTVFSYSWKWFLCCQSRKHLYVIISFFWSSVCNLICDNHICKGPISMTRPCSISSATNKIERIIREPALSRYGSDDGLLEHREALLEKVNSLFLNWEMRTRFWIRGNLLLVGKFSERFTIKVETFWKIYYKSWNFLIQFPPSWNLPTLSRNTSRWPSIKTF